jgi:putative acetyltransferase
MYHPRPRDVAIQTLEDGRKAAPLIRDARDEDSGGIISLIGAVFAEYPGVILDVEGELPELARIASWAREADGEFWVAERDGVVVGTCGYTRAEGPGGFELKKLYVAASERTSGLGSTLFERVLGRVTERGGVFLELWSDVKFETAHRFYEKRGFLRGGTRRLGDKSDTVEYHFRKDLRS